MLNYTKTNLPKHFPSVRLCPSHLVRTIIQQNTVHTKYWLYVILLDQ